MEKWYSEQYYHIYNRGNNHNKIFYNPNNYDFFLSKISEYLLEYLDILAYVLLPNHFHILVKIKSHKVILKNYLKNYTNKKTDLMQNEEFVNKIIGQTLSNMFNSFTKSINKQENRTGGLFEGKCQRKLIKNNEYLNALIAYIHYNPVKHNLLTIKTSNISKTSKVYSQYKYSSFNAILSDKPTRIARFFVLDIFDGIDNFVDFHLNYENYNSEKKIAETLFE